MQIKIQKEKEISDFELGFIVGIYEGEGWFGLRKNRWQNKNQLKFNAMVYARVEVSSTDRDVIEKIKEVLGIENIDTFQPRDKYGKYYKPVWKLGLNSNSAIELANLLYPYLSKRRQWQIEKMKIFHKSLLEDYEILKKLEKSATEPKN